MPIPKQRNFVPQPASAEVPDLVGDSGSGQPHVLQRHVLPLSCFVGSQDFEYESLCTAFERHLGMRIVADYQEGEDEGGPRMEYFRDPSETIDEQLVHAHPLWDSAIDAYGALIHTLLPSYEIHKGVCPSSGNIHLFRDMEEYRECENGLRTFTALCNRNKAKLDALASVTADFVQEYSAAVEELEKLEGDCGPALKGSLLAERVQELSAVIKRKWGHKVERLQSECASKRRRPNLSPKAVGTLKKWFAEHQDKPYPTPEERDMLASQTGMEISQVNNWFTNVRKRYWKGKSTAGGGSDDEDDDGDDEEE